MARRPGIELKYNRTNRVADKIRGELSRVVRETATAVEAGAKQRAPVRTGFLRNSIHTEVADDGLSADVVVGAEYGIYVEMGTRFMSPRPFLVPAVEAERPRFMDAMRRLDV